MYTKPVGEIIKRHNIKYYRNADNTQVYTTLKPHDKWDDVSSSNKTCIENINIWMKCNMLKLNQDKTEFNVFSSK